MMSAAGRSISSVRCKEHVEGLSLSRADFLRLAENYPSFRIWLESVVRLRLANTQRAKRVLDAAEYKKERITGKKITGTHMSLQTLIDANAQAEDEDDEEEVDTSPSTNTLWKRINLKSLAKGAPGKDSKGETNTIVRLARRCSLHSSTGCRTGQPAQKSSPKASPKSSPKASPKTSGKESARVSPAPPLSKAGDDGVAASKSENRTRVSPRGDVTFSDLGNEGEGDGDGKSQTPVLPVAE